MPLSSNTLIHFTANKESLKGILSDNFRVKYCQEAIHWTKNSKFVIHVPMVSFCDIPLSQIKDHISKYGHYGIGLTREWAIKNKLNPVLYVQPDSSLAISYSQLIKDILKASNEYFKNNKDVFKRTIDIARYIKNYESVLERNGKVFRKYRFSDEREWRYVPPYSSTCKVLYTQQMYAKLDVAQEAIQSIESFRLKFNPNDVKYIIIKNDKEISEFIEHLRRAKGKKYSQSNIERLTTRLFTSDQIHKDI
jgi:hypothetical protein